MYMQPDPDEVSIMSETTTLTSMTQDELKASIKELLDLDARIKALSQEKKALDAQKKALSTGLMALMKERAIDSFDTSKTRILYKQRTVQPLGKKTLFSAFQLYFKDDPEAVSQLQTFILENLPERTTESLTLRDKK